jgi:hypothetical protein
LSRISAIDRHLALLKRAHDSTSRTQDLEQQIFDAQENASGCTAGMTLTKISLLLSM